MANEGIDALAARLADASLWLEPGPAGEHLASPEHEISYWQEACQREVFELEMAMASWQLRAPERRGGDG